MLTGNDIVAGVVKVLNDKNLVRWTTENLTAYLNAAVRQVALVRPDATGATAVVELVAGTKQQIPADGLRLLDVVRNMGADGSTPGYPITAVSRAALDAANRFWHKAKGGQSVTNYTFDDRAPHDFYVTPPVGSTPVHVEISYSKSPTPYTVETLDNPLPIDDVYEGPIHDWILHRAFAVEISSQTSQQLARSYEQSFYQALGIKTRSDLATSPNRQGEVLQ